MEALVGRGRLAALKPLGDHLDLLLEALLHQGRRLALFLELFLRRRGPVLLQLEGGDDDLLLALGQLQLLRAASGEADAAGLGLVVFPVVRLDLQEEDVRIRMGDGVRSAGVIGDEVPRHQVVLLHEEGVADRERTGACHRRQLDGLLRFAVDRVAERQVPDPMVVAGLELHEDLFDVAHPPVPPGLLEDDPGGLVLHRQDHVLVGPGVPDPLLVLEVDAVVVAAFDLEGTPVSAGAVRFKPDGAPLLQLQERFPDGLVALDAKMGGGPHESLDVSVVLLHGRFKMRVLRIDQADLEGTDPGNLGDLERVGLGPDPVRFHVVVHGIADVEEEEDEPSRLRVGPHPDLLPGGVLSVPDEKAHPLALEARQHRLDLNVRVLGDGGAAGCDLNRVERERAVGGPAQEEAVQAVAVSFGPSEEEVGEEEHRDRPRQQGEEAAPGIVEAGLRDPEQLPPHVPLQQAPQLGIGRRLPLPDFHDGGEALFQLGISLLQETGQASRRIAAAQKRDQEAARQQEDQQRSTQQPGPEKGRFGEVVLGQDVTEEDGSQDGGQEHDGEASEQPLPQELPPHRCDDFQHDWTLVRFHRSRVRPATTDSAARTTAAASRNSHQRGSLASASATFPETPSPAAGVAAWNRSSSMATGRGWISDSLGSGLTATQSVFLSFLIS